MLILCPVFHVSNVVVYLQTVVATLISSTIVCGYSHQDLQQMQAADSYIGESLKDKEQNL